MGLSGAVKMGYRPGAEGIGGEVMGQLHHDATAFLAADGLAVTHAAMRDDIGRFAQSLLAGGLRPGQRVAISLPPSSDRVSLCVAIWWLGGVVVPVDPGLALARITLALQGSGADLIVHEAARGLNLSSVRSVTVADLRATGGPGNPEALAKQVRKVQPGHPAMILYGDGLQDTARGVVLSHGAILSAAWALSDRYEIGASSVVMAPLPMNHPARLVAEVAVLLRGATLSQQTPFAALATHLILSDGSAPVPDKVPAELQPKIVLLQGDTRTIRAWGRALPQSRVFNSYCRAELGGIAVCSDPRDPVHTASTTAGRPLRGVEVMIVDPRTSMDMLLYEIGEIWIRGASRMLRYHDDPTATRKSIESADFFRTGDMGYLDSEGRVIICRDAFAQV